MARISLATFTLVGVLRIREKWIVLLGWPIWPVMALCYRNSIAAYRRKDPNWVLFHAAFHVCVGTGHAYVVRALFKKINHSKSNEI
uniref:Uncharacterized protein n=1 Tax=viral metagenome TaxID=1070528 RepID=A0A6C0K9L0_9ZZZZ